MATTLRRDGVVWIITLAYLVLAVLSALWSVVIIWAAFVGNNFDIDLN